jgi:transcriptional regulator
MYLPTHFAETRPTELHRLLRDHPFGALVVHGPQGLDANHLPFEYDPQAGSQGRLKAHVARANPLWREVASGSEVLVIFRGPHGYISPNWYPAKQENHRAVPTWNYEVVHAHGILEIRDDEKFVRGVVARLTRTHEAAEPRPWKVGDAPQDYIDAMVAAIVGLEIEVTKLVGKFKLGQNREPRDIGGAAAALKTRGQDALSAAMSRAMPGAPPGPRAE